MTTPTTSRQIVMPSSAPQLVREAWSYVAAILDDGPAELRRALPDQFRRQLESRVREIELELGRRDANAVRVIVTGLLATYARGRPGEREAATVMAGYVAALDLPSVAVAKAAERWMRGQVPGQKSGFPPSPDELYSAASGELDGLRVEQFRLRKVLDGVVIGEQRGERPIDALKARYGPDWGLGAKTKAEREATAADHRRRLEEASQRRFERDCEAAGVDPALGVSPSLLATIAAPDPGGE